jgi:hypothetical protein
MSRTGHAVDTDGKGVGVLIGFEAGGSAPAPPLSHWEVLKAVEGRLVVPPSKQYLKQEVENIIAECDAIGNQVAAGTLPALSADLCRAYNRQVLDQLPVKDDVKPGDLRTHSVIVGNVYQGAPGSHPCVHTAAEETRRTSEFMKADRRLIEWESPTQRKA